MKTGIEGRRDWFLYVLECTGGTLYTGISTDVARRFEQHRIGKGARYTRARPPLRLLASFQFDSQSQALIAEVAFKKLRAAAKRKCCGDASIAMAEAHD
ncbi:MAG: GIY-YIG nuclease family protein [Pseudomonadota bacterium]|nr:GIY-YIG nuclease family protein [Pseudomonadota bacterium]